MPLLVQHQRLQYFLNDIVSTVALIQEPFIGDLLRDSSAIALFVTVMIQLGIAKNYFEELQESLDMFCATCGELLHLAAVVKLLTVPNSDLSWVVLLVWLLGLLHRLLLEYILVWRWRQPPFRWRLLLVHLGVVYYEIAQAYMHECHIFDTFGVYNSNVLVRSVAAIASITVYAYWVWSIGPGEIDD
ncbi:hypothetical protein DL98DRAFT_532925 [Cadophora sp. DSE1049]|nr:hypothetical protein DL98DRAFT_532925 [Cadophora sp. DSE1049]